MERVVALLCNPSAGGGRAARVLPEVEGALRSLAAWKHASSAGYSVAAANSSSCGGGMLLAPGAGLDDGLLDVVTIAAHSESNFLMTLPR